MLPFTLTILLILSHLTFTKSAIFGKESKRKCWSSGNGLPAKWWRQGERIDRGIINYLHFFFLINSIKFFFLNKIINKQVFLSQFCEILYPFFVN